MKIFKTKIVVKSIGDQWFQQSNSIKRMSIKLTKRKERKQENRKTYSRNWACNSICILVSEKRNKKKTGKECVSDQRKKKKNLPIDVAVGVAGGGECAGRWRRKAMAEVDTTEVDRGQEARKRWRQKRSKMTKKRHEGASTEYKTRRENGGKWSLLSVSITFLPDRVRSFFWTRTGSGV